LAKPDPKPEPFRLKGLDEMPNDEVAVDVFGAAQEASGVIAPVESKIMLRRLDRNKDYFKDESPVSAPDPSPDLAQKSLPEPAPEPGKGPRPLVVAPAPKAGPRMHVASYNTKKDAEAGIQKLKAEYPVLAGFSPIVSYEYAESLGYFWRVYFSGPMPDLKKACAALKKSGKWCSVAA
jgi:hypothetical protein